jgi:serine/threonine-protein kinase
MGAVLRAEDRNIRRYFAKKVIDPELASDLEMRARFLMEAQITGQLEHPHIVPVYDLHVSDEGEPTYFAMKLVEGVTLASLVRPNRVAERDDSELWDLLNVFLKVCDAVAYAHSRGVVHRDLKPDNVMVGSYGQVYVMDWGVARVVCGAALEGSPGAQARPVCIDEDAALEIDGTILGTPLYMAPEQAWGRLSEIDARTDVFALGAILYQVLTGRAPYRDHRGAEILQAAREGRIQPPGEVAGNVPLSPVLCDIAMKAMRVAREDRYQSVLDLRRDVERALRGGLWLGTQTFPAGTVILREGDQSDGAYIITKGRCLAYRTERGQQRTLREMGAGEVFGEMALLSSRPRSASVVAVDDVTAIVVTRETLAREIPADSWLLPLLRTLVERFRELDEKARR